MYKVIVLFFLIVLKGYSQTNLILHKDIEKYAKSTKSIAILPIKVNIILKPKHMKKIRVSQLEDLNNKEGIYSQKAMYSWFLKRKERGELIASVQNPEETNSRLIKKGYDLNNLASVSAKELGEILEVDCVVKGYLKTSKVSSDVENILAIALFGITGLDKKNNTATCDFDFFDTRDGESTVYYHKNISGGVFSSQESLFNILFRKVTRRIPYTSN